jgi:hypothetical protein
VTEFDGDGWTLIRSEVWLDEDLRDSPLTIRAGDDSGGRPRPYGQTTMKATDDGALWLESAVGSPEDGGLGELSRWEGNRWAIVANARPDGGRPIWDFDRLRTAPDGLIWLDGLTFIDGDTPRRYHVPLARKAHTRETFHAPNGSIWIVLKRPFVERSETGLYVIDPDVATATPLAAVATE